MTKNQFQEMEVEESWEEIKKVTSKAKERRLVKYKESKTRKITAKHNKTLSADVHKKIKKATGRYKKRVPDTIKTNDGELVREIKEKLNVWQKYFEKLFQGTERPQREYFPETERPEITQSEVKYAIKTAKGGKALGPDEIPVELLKVMEKNYIQLLITFFKNASGIAKTLERLAS
ncbi:hypothetical protein ILUMI_23742 [Ignelater luminosus]|uniref:Uncharacterized protein n=1 Tax=Ignelater luminosus TaxID=2038154 RepID=A0A8K0CDA5_IGNLU|nr:hypothetical protein ILUMI_23742 [Ignelater luminosus]